jgi:phosphoglycolate phosphatase
MENKIMIKMVAFDLDGTIGDTLPMCIRTFQETVFHCSGRRLSENDVIRTFGLSAEGMMRETLGDDWEKVMEDYYIRYQRLHTMCPDPFEGIKELITELKTRHVLVALITGKGEKSCRITVRQFGLENYFDSVNFGSPDRNVKSEALVTLIDKYNLQPDELVYIGDAVSDIISCNQVNIKCLSAGWATSADLLKQLQEYNDGYVFQTVQSLKEYLFNRI